MHCHEKNEADNFARNILEAALRSRRLRSTDFPTYSRKTSRHILAGAMIQKLNHKAVHKCNLHGGKRAYVIVNCARKEATPLRCVTQSVCHLADDVV